jgi:hypothetical protein
MIFSVGVREHLTRWEHMYAPILFILPSSPMAIEVGDVIVRSVQYFGLIVMIH